MEPPYTRGEIEGLGDEAWPTRGPFCERCRVYLPQFADVSPEEERRLRMLPAMEAVRRLREQTGCSMRWAKIWLLHPDGPQPKRDAGGPPCPCCAKPLRTPQAQQCFHCGADWHQRPRPPSPAREEGSC